MKKWFHAVLASSPVGGGTDVVLEQPVATDHSTEQIVENNLVGSSEFSSGIDFGTVAASDGTSLGAAVNTASTLMPESRVMGFTESQSACDAIVGTGTQLSVEFENDTEQNILNSQNDLEISSINWIATQTALILICWISTI